MRVAITGSSGLVGSALAAHLESRGDEVLRLVRPGSDVEDGAAVAHWDPASGSVQEGALEEVDAAVHLAGADIAGKRWSESRKQLLWESRVDSARLLVDHIQGLSSRPRVLVGASAIGYYGDRGDETLTEQSSAGEGFLAELCQAWERETARASEFGLRTVHVRTAATVLSRHGGALPRMLTPFRMGVGGGWAAAGSGSRGYRCATRWARSRMRWTTSRSPGLSTSPRQSQ